MSKREIHHIILIIKNKSKKYFDSIEELNNEWNQNLDLLCSLKIDIDKYNKNHILSMNTFTISNIDTCSNYDLNQKLMFLNNDSNILLLKMKDQIIFLKNLLIDKLIINNSLLGDIIRNNNKAINERRNMINELTSYLENI